MRGEHEAARRRTAARLLVAMAQGLGEGLSVEEAEDAIATARNALEETRVWLKHLARHGELDTAAAVEEFMSLWRERSELRKEVDRMWREECERCGL
jgi:hypothetical protein